MKTRVKKMFLLAIVVLIPNLVNAESACSYNEQAEINNIVANVKASYEVVEVSAGKVLDIDHQDENGNIPEIEYFEKGFDISILNITEDIYVKVTNKNDNSVMTYKFADTNNGTLTFRTMDIEKLNTYTFEVYANKYQCVGELFRKFTLDTPMYNPYSEMIACQENPEFYYCQAFIPSENITLNEFKTKVNEFENDKKLEEEKEKNKKSFIERIKEFYSNNSILINILGIGIVLMGVGATVILVKKKRSRVL